MKTMNYSKKLSFLLSTAVLIGAFIFSACSKNTPDEEMPDPIIGGGTASAMVEFMDTGEKVEFKGSAMGTIISGSADTVLLHFIGLENTMRFMIMMTPVSKGKHTMGQNGFEVVGALFPDTASSVNYLKAYLVGEDNIADNDTEMDGAATFDISSMSRDQMTGNFQMTMIRNTTIKEDGEIISGDIREVRVTNGKFDAVLFGEN